MTTMTAEPKWLRVSMSAHAIGVDREAGVIRGMILCEEGDFKDGRGMFDRQSIRRSVKLANEKSAGLRSRFAHPNLSADGLGKHLGRIKGVRTDTVLREVGKDTDGKPLMKERLIARGDLNFDKTALEEPVGGGKPLGAYIMDLVDSDPDALGASLVLKVEQTPQLDTKGRPLKDEDGNELPPHWMPTSLLACDCVDDGDATHSFLSADMLAGLPDAIVRQGCELLDAQFAGQDKDVVRARLSAFIDRYLSYRFGEEEELATEPPVERSSGSGVSQPLGVFLNQDGKPVAPTTSDGLMLDLWLVGQE